MTAGFVINGSFAEGFSDNWGARYSGPLPETEGEEINLIENEAVFAGLPSRVTVTTFWSPGHEAQEIAALLGVNAHVRAVILFGCGAASDQIECDWGQSVSVPANRITVRAKSFRPIYGDVYERGVSPEQAYSIKIGALLSLGSVPHPAYYTTLQDSGNVPIPRAARRLFVGLTLGSTADYFGNFDSVGLDIVQMNTTGQDIVVTALTPHTRQNGIEIVPEASHLKVMLEELPSLGLLRTILRFELAI